MAHLGVDHVVSNIYYLLKFESFIAQPFICIYKRNGEN